MSLDGPELEVEEGSDGPGEKLLRTLGGDRGSASPLPRIYVRELSLFLLISPTSKHTSNTECDLVLGKTQALKDNKKS